MKRLFLILLMIMVLPFNAMAIDEFDPTEPAGTDNISTGDQVIRVNNEALDRLLTNYKRGLSISYTSATTITVAIGEISVATSAGVLRFRSNPTTTTVTFSDIDTGAEAAGVYYIYALGDVDQAAATFVFSLSASAPTGATYYKQIGSFTNDASKNITSSTVTNLPVIAGSTPTGSIVIWSGSEASIPSGWSLCDGTNGTPDLTDKFVVGAGDTYAVNATGGSATHTLTISEMPAHTHLTYFKLAAAGGSAAESPWTASGSAGNKATSSTGGGVAHENRPPYYALAYIMKN